MGFRQAVGEGDVQAVRGGVAQDVGHNYRDGIEDVAVVVLYGGVVGVADDAGRRVVAGQGQLAFAAVNRVGCKVGRVGQLGGGEAFATDAQAAQASRGADREAASDRAVGFSDGLVTIGSARVVAVRDVQARQTVGVAVDGDGQGGRRAAAVTVGQGVGVAVGQRFAVVQSIDRRVRVVQRVGVAAVGIQNQVAVAQGYVGRGHRIGVHVGADRVGTRALQYVAVGDQGRVFGDGVGVGMGFRQAVGEGDVQTVRGGVAQDVGHNYRDGIEDVAVVVLYGGVVGVADDAGRRVVAGQGQQPFAAVNRVGCKVARVGQLGGGEVLASHAQAAQASRGVNREAASDRSVGFSDGLVAIGSARVVAVRDVQARQTVGVAVDGDGQGGRRAAAVTVGQRVGVAAVGIQNQVAVAQGYVGRGHRIGVHVGADRVGTRALQYVAVGDQGRVFGDGVGVGMGFRQAVGEGDVQAVRGGVAQDVGQ